MDIIITIFALSLLVFIHELGHFLIARFFGVKIEVFSIGIGPKIFKYESGGTIYALSLIPLGGYCSMKGEQQDKGGEIEIDSLSAKKWWQRILVVLAGPMFNLFLAWILIIASFYIGRSYNDMSPIISSADNQYSIYFHENDEILEVNGQEVKSYTDIFRYTKENSENIFLVKRSVNDEDGVEHRFSSYITFKVDDLYDFYSALSPQTSNIIGDVSPGLPAWKAGIRKGDKILRINDLPVNNWKEVRDGIAFSENDIIRLLVEREGRTLELTLIAEKNILSETNQRMIGITQHLDLTFHEKSNFLTSIGYGSITTITVIYLNYKTLYNLFTNPTSLKNSIGGPIMLYYMTSHTTKRGLSDFMTLIAMISIVLMIMNLLPIPVFDGGHIMFFLYEGIMKKSLPISIQWRLQQFGFTLIVFLMVYVFYSDINKTFQKFSSEMKWQKILPTEGNDLE